MMNDNNAYIVQCTRENYDEAKYLIQMFCRILAVDDKTYCIKTFSLDSTLKQRLDEMGASFWQESSCTIKKSAVG